MTVFQTDDAEIIDFVCCVCSVPLAVARLRIGLVVVPIGNPVQGFDVDAL